MDSILACDPIDRVARRVTDQRGCEDELTKFQLRENLVKKAQRLQAIIKTLPKKHPDRKEIGLAIHANNQKIIALKDYKTPAPKWESFFIEVVREKMSKIDMRLLVDEAHRRAREWEGSENPELLANNTEG